MNNMGQLGPPSYPPEEHFVIGVMLKEMAHATTWERIIRVAEAIQNIREKATTMRAEMTMLNAQRQQMGMGQQQVPAADPEYRAPQYGAAPDYDQQWGQE